MFGKAIKYIPGVILMHFTLVTFAQTDTTLTQEVEVVKAYDPTVQDANKISSMPEIEDASHEKPSFNYSIFSQPIYNTFSVNTLKAATFSSEPPHDHGYGMVKAGIGNYNRPYGELFFNSKDMRKTLFGLHGRHNSSHGKLTLESGERVKAPFSENEAELFVKHLFRSSVLSFNLGFDHQGFNYYGYPGDSIPAVLMEEDQEINYFGSRQTFSKGSLHVNLDNSIARRDDFTFDFDFLYHYFGTKTGQREHFGTFMADVKKPFDAGVGLLKAGATFVQAENIFNRYLMETGESRQIWLTAQPAYQLGGDIARLNLGFKGWFVLDEDQDAHAKIAPNVRAELAPVEEIITIYAGVSGDYVNNHYSKIAYENPFVDPTHHVKNTFEQYHFFGGFDGKFATQTNFKIGVDYSKIQDRPLYFLNKFQPHPETLEPAIVDNDFDVLYDDLDLLKFNAELFHSAFDKMNLLISGNYYVYKMTDQEEAWNLPEWDAKLALEYQISEQLDVSTELFFIGSRQALIVPNSPVLLQSTRTEGSLARSAVLQDVEGQMESYNLEPVFDLNFSANYKITPQFSVFALLNNFGFQQYQRWLGYPVQSFNALAGLSYAF